MKPPSKIPATYTRDTALRIVEALLDKAFRYHGELTHTANLRVSAALEVGDFEKAARVSNDPANLDTEALKEMSWVTSSASALVEALIKDKSDPINLSIGQGLEELYAETLEGLYELPRD